MNAITTTTKEVKMMSGFYTQRTHTVEANKWRIVEHMTGVMMLDAQGKVRHINGRSPFDAKEAIEFAQTQSN